MIIIWEWGQLVNYHDINGFISQYNLVTNNIYSHYAGYSFYSHSRDMNIYVNTVLEQSMFGYSTSWKSGCGMNNYFGTLICYISTPSKKIHLMEEKFLSAKWIAENWQQYWRGYGVILQKTRNLWMTLFQDLQEKTIHYHWRGRGIHCW